MKISVLGCGRWGSFLAWYTATHQFATTLWGRKGSRSLQELKDTGKNAYVTLPENIRLTDSLEEAVKDADLLIVSIHSQGLREFSGEMAKYGAKEKTLILCMKGLEENTGKRLTEQLIEEGYDPNRILVWVGPGHIQEFVKKRPSCMIMAGYNKDLVYSTADLLKSKLIRFYYGNDIIGTEVGAAAKNVMGIAAGMLDGVDLSTLKGPLMARGAREVARLILAMGGDELTAYGLSHLGDYETTLFSPHSNNRNFGIAYVKGEKFEKIAEGVSTAKALYVLAEKYHVDLPISRAIYKILYEHARPEDRLLKLFEREAVSEFWI